MGLTSGQGAITRSAGGQQGNLPRPRSAEPRVPANHPELSTGNGWTGSSLRGSSGIGQPRMRVDGKFFAREGCRFHVRGVTYGPFEPNPDGDQFPSPERVRDDFARMKQAGINTVRTYHVPPEWLLELADTDEMGLLIDVPWPKHLCFLESPQAMAEARRNVADAVSRSRSHACVIACSIGNEIPADVVRWHGAPRVERFLAELADAARQVAPEVLLTYANYPSTEYLELPFLDFATFNVYLHDPEEFRRYLLRLHNLVGDRPLLLGEIGMDTQRYGEAQQAEFLGGHLREAALSGLAGAFVFSWTDDWYTGGFQIKDWAFGLTTAERSPKPSLAAVAGVFRKEPWQLLPETPRVSVLVCSYNGGRTLEQCLLSLSRVNYPDYEVVLVDDGSTDDTPSIAARFPSVRYLRQENEGLSVARNTAVAAATGAIVAYTDSDCYADPDWLTLLVYQLQQTGADGVGGPNLTPDDGWLAACVAAAPGQPGHVLINDQVAEHVPGCNMAYYRDAVLGINGFRPIYRKAGDDVDFCWRLQQDGKWITFAPAAFVWHHRRQNARAYLRQQAGYGNAEGLLWFDHPDRFNALGGSKWTGELYGGSSQGLRLGSSIIYHGAFGTGLFQTLYRPGLVHIAMLPSTLEWQLAAALAALSALFWLPMLSVAAAMLVTTVIVITAQSAQAPLAPGFRNLRSRLVVFALCYCQPLVRGAARFQTRFFPPEAPFFDQPLPTDSVRGAWFSKPVIQEYWDEEWRDRTELLHQLMTRLADSRWTFRVGSGWESWDLEIFNYAWTKVQVFSTQEDHGSGRRLIRLRYRLRASGYLQTVALAALISCGIAWTVGSLPLLLTVAFWLVILLPCLRNGTGLADRVLWLGESAAAGMGLIRIGGKT